MLLLPRRAATLWTRLAPSRGDDAELGSRARLVAEHLAAHGASFFDEIADAVRLLPAELEDALAELVVARPRQLRQLRRPARAARSRGEALVGARAPAPRRHPDRHRRRGPLVADPVASERGRRRAGKAKAAAAPSRVDADALEHVARILLRRYGVVCWRLLEREAAWLPPWRELVRVYRRLEARGEIRGGRFIAGLSGEQFALPEAIASMREVRRRPADDALVCLAASDPANLLGTVVAGPKVARIAGARVVWRDGVPLATSVGGEVEALLPLDRDALRAASDALRQGPVWRLPVAAPRLENTPLS